MRPTRGLFGLLLVLALTIGCEAGRPIDPGPRTFEFTLAGDDLIDPVRIVVDDRTGLVARAQAQIVLGFELVEGVTNPPGQPNRLVVAWLGGMCDLETVVLLEASGPGLRVGTRTTEAGGACLLAGITRWVVLDFAVPAPAEAIVFVSDRP